MGSSARRQSDSTVHITGELRREPARSYESSRWAPPVGRTVGNRRLSSPIAMTSASSSRRRSMGTTWPRSDLRTQRFSAVTVTVRHRQSQTGDSRQGILQNGGSAISDCAIEDLGADGCYRPAGAGAWTGIVRRRLLCGGPAGSILSLSASEAVIGLRGTGCLGAGSAQGVGDNVNNRAMMATLMAVAVRTAVVNPLPTGGSVDSPPSRVAGPRGAWPGEDGGGLLRAFRSSRAFSSSRASRRLRSMEEGSVEFMVWAGGCEEGLAFGGRSVSSGISCRMYTDRWAWMCR